MKNKLTKSISVLLAFLMVASFMAAGLSALKIAALPGSYYEYGVDTTDTSDLETVFSGVATVTEESSVITIKLIANVYGRIRFFNTDGSYILDLNGYTIDAGGVCAEALCLDNNFSGTVTVTGSGTFTTGYNNVIYNGGYNRLKFAVEPGYNAFTLLNGSVNVFDEVCTGTKTLPNTYNHGTSYVLTQLLLPDFEADTSLLYSTCIDKIYVGLLVETSEIPNSATAYGVEIDSVKYPATSILVDGKYISDIQGLAADTDFTAKPYYTLDGNDHYADGFSFTTAPARITVSGFAQTYYANSGDKIAIGYGTKSAGNGGALDFIGNNGTSWIHSTYSDAGWAYKFGDSDWVETSGPKVAVYNSSPIQAWVVPTTSSDGNFGIVTYYIRNISDTTVTDFKFGSAADIKIASQDYAPISKKDYGISMTDNVNTFALICREGYANISEPVTTLWFGAYGSARSSVYTNTASDSLTGTDSGAAYSWQGITLQSGEIKEYKIELGIGDASALESLIKPSAAINFADETITSLTPGSVYIITVGGSEYKVTADSNGEIAIAGTDDNGQPYNFMNKDISIAETKEIGGIIQVSTPQNVTIPSRPNAVVPEYHSPDDAIPELPDSLDITTTESSITIKATSGQEYSIDGGSTWVTPAGSGNVTFTGLADGTTYGILTRIAATSSSFASYTETFYVKISKMLTITDVTINGKVQTYDGTTKALTISADGAAVSYSTVLAGPYSATFPECIGAGTYTIYYKLSKAGYHDYYNVAELEIVKYEVTVPTIASKAYTGNTLKADISSNAYYTVSENNGGINAGNYDVVLTLVDSANHKWADGTATAANTLTFKITQATANAIESLSIVGWTYGDSKNLPSATATFGTPVFSYKGTGSTSYAESSAAPTNAGTYKVIATVTETADYVGASDELDFTIAKADASCIAPTANTGLVYNDGEQALVTVGSTSDGTMQYSLDGISWAASVPKAKNAGDYTVYYRVVGDSNHNDNSGSSVDVTIAKADPSYIAPTAKTGLVYNGAAQELINAGSTNDGEMRYAIGGTQATTEIPTGTDAGEYRIICIIVGDENHNDAVVASTSSPIVSDIAQAFPIENTEKPTTARIKRKNALRLAAVKSGEFLALDGVTALSGTFEWVDPSEVIDDDTIKSMRFIPDDANYAEVEFDVAVESYIPTPGTLPAGGSTDASNKDKFDKNEPIEDDGVCDGTRADNCASISFTDLNTKAWYHLDTDYVIENGIFKGVSEKSFAPNANLTRAMLVTVLYRVEGEPATNRSIPFADIDMNAYYANAVIWAQQNGIVKGISETEFAPNNNITREQIAAIMHRYAQYKGYDVSVGESTNILSYNDFAELSEYAIPSMQWACGSGLIKGKTASTLNPLDSATRAEVAAILHRYIESNK